MQKVFLVLCLLIGMPDFCLAEPIIESSCLNLNSDGGNSFSLVVPDAAKSGKLTVQKMFLSNPSRAVVDVVGLKCSIARNVNVSGSSSIASVRLGSHSDRVRVVFELKPSTKRDLSYSFAGNTVNVKLGEAAETDQPATQVDLTPPVKPVENHVENHVEKHVEKPIAKPVEKEKEKVVEKPVEPPVEKTADPNEEDELFKEKKDEPETHPSAIPQMHMTDGLSHPEVETSNGTPVKVVPEATTTTTTMPAVVSSTTTTTAGSRPASTSGRTEINAIYFQLTKSGNAPAAVIDLSAVVPYILTKKREDLYELDIDNAQLSGRHMLLPQFPPDNFTGFSAIIAQELGGKVTIQIFVEEGMQLLPFTAEGKLWVRIGKK